MNTIQVEGVIYTKASLLAKSFRYTTDYIGQLCRSGKVDCQLVGRAWYVSESSLLRHKDARYKEVRVNEKTIKNSTKIDGSEEVISVNPRLKRVTAKQLQESKSHFLSRVGTSSSKYFSDETELLPQPLRRPAIITPIMPEKIAIESAEATTVKVSSLAKPGKLTFTELPEVPLKGHIKLTEVEIKEDIAPVTPEEVAKVNVEPAVVKSPAGDFRGSSARPSQPQLRSKLPASAFTPQTVVSKTEPRVGFLVPLALVAAMTLFLFVTISTQRFIIVGSDVSASIFFSLEGLRELL